MRESRTFIPAPRSSNAIRNRHLLKWRQGTPVRKKSHFHCWANRIVAIAIWQAAREPRNPALGSRFPWPDRYEQLTCRSTSKLPQGAAAWRPISLCIEFAIPEVTGIPIPDRTLVSESARQRPRNSRQGSRNHQVLFPDLASVIKLIHPRPF